MTKLQRALAILKTYDKFKDKQFTARQIVAIWELEEKEKKK